MFLPESGPAPDAAKKGGIQTPEQGIAGSRLSDQGKISDDRADIRNNDRILLVIEDDPNFAKTLYELAHEKMYKCLIAADGETGVELACRYRPAAVVLDIGLPDIGGWTVADRLKGDTRTRHIPIHVISASDSPEEIKQDIIGYLTKPVSMEQFDTVFNEIEKVAVTDVRKILIVEDNDIQREALMNLTDRGGITPVGAESAEEAYDLLKKGVFDCMILDLGLKGMSGFELLKKLRDDEVTCRLPVIIHTGRDLSRDEKSELQLYSESVVMKNEKSSEKLLEEISRFLSLVETEQPEDGREEMTSVPTDSPVAECPEPDEPDKPAEGPVADLTGKKILIADDDMRNVFVLTSLLEEKEADVIVAGNGKEALEQLELNPDIVLVVMDIMMPEMDGYEAMSEIRKQERFTGLPVIALTAKAMKEDREKCIKAGASDYLSKPVDIDRFFSLMQKWV